MKAQTKIIPILFALPLLLAGDCVQYLAKPPEVKLRDQQRVRFQIATVEETAGQRHTISEATVEGPPGTDFQVDLQAERFKMDARFLTDLGAPGALKVRARLNTRRLYGYSERKLPVYEEDAQNESLQLGFDEGIVLLPFGRSDGEERLKIEITPMISEQTVRLPSGKARPLEIKILKPGPGGISIQATKIPHHFAVEAALLEDGRVVAHGTANYLIEEGQELLLEPNDQAGPEIARHPLAVNLTVSEYARSRPADQATLSFDIYRADQQQGRREAIALKWAGIASLGSDLTYDLRDIYLPSSGKNHELRFKVKLAEGEQAD